VHSWWFVAAAVGAAFAFASSSHLKHLSAGDVPDAQNLRPTALGRFIRASVAHRLWLAGIVADAFGLGLQLLALHWGALAAVQPLLVLGLLFALLMRQGHRGRLRPRELGWAGLIAASLAGALLLLDTGSAAGHASADLGPAIASAAAGLVIAVACVLLGRQQRGSGRTAALLGVTVGMVYACTAALLKALTDIAARDPLSLLWSWQLYTVLVVGGAGLVLNQLAFQAGPLTASLPAIATVDPLASVAIGVWVFDEHVRHGLAADAALAVLLVLLAIGVIPLARSCADDQLPARPQDADRSPEATDHPPTARPRPSAGSHPGRPTRLPP
jgi:drug/metabolite transporter (DMT)-like permease